MPYLARIWLYPFKSLDGVSVQQAMMLASGALAGDRTFALVDEQGLFVNGKRNAKVHQLRSFFESTERMFFIRVQDTQREYAFHIDRERGKLEAWLKEYYGMEVRILQNETHGFPDDTKAPGPTLIGVSSLEAVASWFQGIDMQTFPPRFRANLEIADALPFWEDRLFGEVGTCVAFRIGVVRFEGMNPCQRCVVPPRDPVRGENYPFFQKIFMERRQESLPEWATRSRFNHFYRLALNTCVPASEAGKMLRVGDECVLLER